MINECEHENTVAPFYGVNRCYVCSKVIRG